MADSSTNDEAKPPSYQPLLRSSLYFKRRSDITEKEFSDHWSKVHASLTKERLVKYGVVGYTQVCLDSLLFGTRIGTTGGSKALWERQVAGLG